VTGSYQEFYRGRKVLITGGLGFIGSNLARRLVELEARVLLVDSLIPDYGGNLFNIDGIADRVRVNAIAPGAIETPMLARSFARHAEPVKVRDASRRRHALERFGTPSEIAEAALYLASDGAAFTTGTTLVVDGGWLAA
jgi:NAD(P)-dependent dehydrogenase (short-subunit alcohol dehydrogenase family)